MTTEEKIDKIMEDVSDIKLQNEQFKAKFSEGDKRLIVLESHANTCFFSNHKIIEAVNFVAEEKKSLEGAVEDFKKKQEMNAVKDKEKISGLVKIWFLPVTIILTVLVTWIATNALAHLVK